MTSAYLINRRKPLKTIWTDLMRINDSTREGQADEVAAFDRLTDRAIAEDMDWVRGVVARELRRQARRAEDLPAAEDQRMSRAAALRERGLTVRAIAEHLEVSVGTVHSDLKRWGKPAAVVTEVAFRKNVQSSTSDLEDGQDATEALNAEVEQPTAIVTPLRRSS
jgi:IS30 family transposase